ncbi:hypothetical protein [Fusibacter tunisiensis]|uniref:hypothetical protein n=1 Tax=Fusibacter tunisiensis TaxID=1008308 RepID=UPI00195AE65C|nr:hypothetical protein [Fusibacter tunisiensis]
MGQFYPEIFSQQKHDGVFVGACVGGELHELGMRMVMMDFHWTRPLPKKQICLLWHMGYCELTQRMISSLMRRCGVRMI